MDRKELGLSYSKGIPLSKNISLTLVIPCFNESSAVPLMAETISRFSTMWIGDLQILLVDDGSNDSFEKDVNASKGLIELKGRSQLELITIKENVGKGGALKQGVEKVKTDFFLTLDADMSAKPENLFQWLESKGSFQYDQILVGSREHPNSIVTDRYKRRLAGRIFNRMVRILTPLNLKDTQCGFKLYPEALGKELFDKLETKGWAHDVEILTRAKKRNIACVEMPVVWKYMEGSKIRLFRDAIKMLQEVLAIRKKVAGPTL